jgi:two-component system, OmpR family, sensor histidine kinase MprB
VKHARPAPPRPADSRFSPRGLFKRLSLQGRFALLAAVAVSVAVVGAALASYFLVSEQLYGEINANLSRSSILGQPNNGRPGGGDVNAGESGNENNNPERGGTGTSTGPPPGSNQYDIPTQLNRCLAGSQTGPSGGLGGTMFEIIRASDGAACGSGGFESTSVTTKATATQLAIASGTQTGGVFYDTYINGEHVRVYTIKADATPGYAISFVQSLTPADNALRRLEYWLAVAAIAGIALATGAGLLLARSATRPVRRLTAAVEHVARTEDLSISLPVDGKDEINRLGASFNKMTKALATSRDRQRRLIADAGHELRTPLTSLRTNVDLLLRSERTGRELPPGRRENMLVSVDQQLHELSGLVTDLLELSRGQEGGTRRTMRVALHESVGRAVERAKLRGPGLSFDVQIEPWYVQGDPTGVDRAVVNLLDNAVKFSPAHGTVTVRLNQGEYIVVDQGPGIAAADLPHVFERFWRSDNARSLPGSGLGLSIVAQVAEESGGAVSLEAAPGGGALARLRLPGDAGTAPIPASQMP